MTKEYWITQSCRVMTEDEGREEKCAEFAISGDGMDVIVGIFLF
jgi:hypothetical protein